MTDQLFDQRLACTYSFLPGLLLDFLLLLFFRFRLSAIPLYRLYKFVGHIRCAYRA